MFRHPMDPSFKPPNAVSVSLKASRHIMALTLSSSWQPSTTAAHPIVTRAPQQGIPYVEPPSHPLTLFTPHPSCLEESNLWLVTTSCYIQGEGYNNPPWLTCTITEYGDPNTKADCYPRDPSTISPDGITYFYSGCPAGYTKAGTGQTHWIFDSTSFAPGISITTSYDAYLGYQTCCPFGPFSFKLSTANRQITTVRDGATKTIEFNAGQPDCVASRVSSYAGKTVTLAQYSDTFIWERRMAKKRTDSPFATTAVWDVQRDTLLASAVTFSSYVFHGTYTCYKDCSQYFTFSYSNTDPNAPPRPTTRPITVSATEDQEEEEETGMVPTPTPTGSGESVTTTRNSNIAAAGRVDGGVRLFFVLTVVTLIIERVV